MKKLLCLLMLGFGIMSFAQDRAIRFNELPQKGQHFVKTYFNPKHISAVILDDDIIKKEYEVILTNGTKIEFDGSGNWKEVDGKRNPIPAGFAPKSIVSYVKKSFPNTHIIKIEKKRFSYEVELSNGLDIDFDSKGNFLRIDD
ncbi:PepSY-like domain-containing protein [Faecalibacter sp. LW9]|uniref:PepSY-like domain-containing protein n=1 Tax=Faecalibacter sp. LW9 TaxID=3103144 RepID=UPI002AFDF20F|nr:PepSY-like domain-containing protein [Faecalibacter sp. LW9]